jgi:hypothetical protein
MRIGFDRELSRVSPELRLTWSWRNRPAAGKPPAPPMRVEWILTPVDGGTRLELVQTGLEGQPWLIPLAMGWGWRLYLRRYLPMALKNVRGGRFTPGAIPLAKRAYRATNLPPEIIV